MSAAMYANSDEAGAGGAAPETAGATAADSSAADDDAIDAEFEVKD